MTWEWENDRRENPPDRPYSKHLPEGTPTLSGRMVEYLRGRDLSYEVAKANHWYGSYCAGDRSPRLVIPATSKIPGNVYWQARAMDDNPKRYQSPSAPRGDAIVVVWPLVPHPERSVVVEGPLDALAAAGAGCMGVAFMGATPPLEALRLTATMIRGTICSVVADRDAMPAAMRWFLHLSTAGIRAKLMNVDPYKDLAEVPADTRLEMIAWTP